MDAKNKRNFILLGHAQSGKTSLTESLLYFCKATNRKGSIAEGTTVSDYSHDEIERKSSINSSLSFCDYKGLRLQIIDAPGYADFFGEVISGIRGVDSAIIVVDATAGVEVGTENVWQILEENNLPCMIFINKIDKEGVDVNKVLQDIRGALSKKATIIDSLDQPDVVEAIAESDDKLLEKYLEGTKLSGDELKSGLTQAVIKRKIFPVFLGSAFNDKGISELLEGIIQYLPSPIQRNKIAGKNPANPEQQKEIEPSEQADFCAFVFKRISDPYVGQLSLFSVFSGTLLSNTGLYNVNKEITAKAMAK